MIVKRWFKTTVQHNECLGYLAVPHPEIADISSSFSGVALVKCRCAKCHIAVLLDIAEYRLAWRLRITGEVKPAPKIKAAGR